MTLEDVLVGVLAMAAGILLFLGLAQALDARPPQRRRPAWAAMPAGDAPASVETAEAQGPTTSEWDSSAQQVGAAGILIGGFRAPERRVPSLDEPDAAPADREPDSEPEAKAEIGTPWPAAAVAAAPEAPPVAPPEVPIVEPPASEPPASAPAEVVADVEARPPVPPTVAPTPSPFARPPRLEPRPDRGREPLAVRPDAVEETHEQMSLREVTAAVPPAAPTEPMRAADAPPAAEPEPVDVAAGAIEAGSSVAAAVECARLYREAQDVDVVALAEGCAPVAGPPVPDLATAAVLALRGLAHRRQGSPERAADMLALAVERLPVETEMAPAALGPVAALAGRELSAGADASAAGTGVLVELRLATALLRVASGLAPSDTELSSRLRQSREAQWLAYEQCASTLLGRRDFVGAHHVIQEALGAGVLPPARESSFRDLLWTSVTGEIGRLTGQALNPEVETEEQVARLAEAESIIRDLPEDALTEVKGEDLVRRVWWGYMKLGTQRVEARDLDGALEPLYRALRLGEVDADRQQETRRLLLETLDGIVDRWSAGIRRLAADGNQAGARREATQLAELIDDAGRRGLAGDDLAAVTARRDEILALVADPH